MNITIMVTGSLKENYLKFAQDDILGKILKKSYITSVEIKEFKDLSIGDKLSPKEEEKIKINESENIIKNLKKDDYLVCLDLSGKPCKKDFLKGLVNEAKSLGKNRIVFVIGGSLGISHELLDLASTKIKFSNLTYPHQLFRISLLNALELYL